MMDQRPIVAFGDFMFQLLHSGPVGGSYQRTVKLDWGAAELGGAVWNVAWNLHPFGHQVRTAGHYGPDAAPYLASLPGVGCFGGGVCKSQPTDRLLVLKQSPLPALYLLETLQEDDIAALCTRLNGMHTVVFAGSRHPELRARYRETVAAHMPELTIFSPSYSIYEYTTEELDDFLCGADITFVNEHEAQFLCSVFRDQEIGNVMARSRRGGVVTRAAAGASLYQRDAMVLALDSTSGVAGDVVGAGEAFMCGFIEGFLQTGDFVTAGRLGIAVSAQTARDGRVCTPIDVPRARAEAGLQ